MWSPKSATKIAPITTLRKELDYGDPQQPRCEAFVDDVRVFRKTFVTSNGAPGSSLHDWKSRDHQRDLLDMTDAYLERDRKGHQFWPEDQQSPFYNRLQYSKWRSRIKRIMMHLFFRLNLQQHRNSKYKRRNDSEAAGNLQPPSSDALVSIRQRGFTDDDPVDLETSEIKSEGRILSPTQVSNDPYTTFTSRSIASDSNHVGPALGRPSASPVPKREPSSEPSLSGSQSRFRAFGQQSASRRPFAEMSDEEPPPKKVKKEHDSPTKSRVSASAGNKGKGKGKEPLSMAQRLGSRERQVRQLPESATVEELDACQLSFYSRSTSPSPGDTVAGGRQPGPSALDSAMAAPRTPNPDLRTTLKKTPTKTGRETGHSTGGQAPTLAPTTISPDMPPTQARVPELSSTSAPATVQTVSAVTDAEATEEAASTVAAEGTSKEPSKEQFKQPPALEFVYRAIHSRSPSLESEEWTPQGGFRGMTHAQVLASIPLELDGDSKGLLFTLVGPSLHIKERVYHGQGSQFQSMKKKFEKNLRSCIRQQQRDRADVPSLMFELQVEAIKDEKAKAVTSEDVFEGDINW